jgi:hypothetical protein
MKRQLALIWLVNFVLTACTTVKDLEKRPVCSVWKDQGVFGPLETSVVEKSAQLKGKCHLGFWLCNLYETRMNADKSIEVRGPGLFSDFTKVATYSDGEVSYEKTFLDGIVHSSPLRIDQVERKVTRDVTLSLFGERTDHQELRFNPACSRADAAIGAVAVWAKENSR